MKKTFLVGLLYACVFTAAYALQQTQFSQYTLNINGINPAYTGLDEMIHVTGVHRQQWLNLKRAPQTTFLNVDLPFSIEKSKHGAAIGFLNEDIGLFSDQSIFLKYAYHKLISETTTLSGGLALQFKSLGFNTKDVNLGNSDYHTPNDPAIPTGSEVSDLKTDIGIGAMLSDTRYIIGVAVQQILSPTYQLNNTEFRQKRQLNIIGMYNISLNNPLYVVKPSVLVKTDFASWQIETGANIAMNEKYWGGIGYRWQDALIFQAGLQLTNGLTIGYSFDFPVSSMLYTSVGTHELVLSYKFKIELSKKQSYKSIRFL